MFIKIVPLIRRDKTLDNQSSFWAIPKTMTDVQLGWQKQAGLEAERGIRQLLEHSVIEDCERLSNGKKIAVCSV